MIVPRPLMAVLVVRDGRLPAGTEEAVAEAGGAALMVGAGADRADVPIGAREVWRCATDPAGPATLAALLAPVLQGVRLVVVPSSPDGRDLAPALAAEMNRPLLAGTVSCAVQGGTITAEVVRVDGRVLIPATCDGPAVATLLPGSRAGLPPGRPVVHDLDPGPLPHRPDPEVVALIEPDPATMDLSEAARVVSGGAGLVRSGATDAEARATFELLASVASALGASAGATRVVTDAGWMGYDRQIGTTGVTVNPTLYLAVGVSGASQHVGGLGDPDVTISVNTDPSCPMTAMADLGLVTDGPSFLLELARRLDVQVPAGLAREVPA